MHRYERLIEDWAKSRAAQLGLKSGNLTAAYIPNIGGFTNRSFHVTDGCRRLHVKFVPADNVGRLERWAAAGHHLTRYYTAPAVVDVIAQEMIPGFPYGLVFEYAEGQPLTEVEQPEHVMEDVMRTIARLHRDRGLAGMIGQASNVSYADAFNEVYISRFEEDLEVIGEGRALLDFVSNETIAWFRDETARLKADVERSAAFAGKAQDVVHNDMNGHNVLAAEGGFTIIDWDDLTAEGDAAADYSMLLWPLRGTEAADRLRALVPVLAGPETAERLALYDRAKLLDDVIDVLADYIDAERYPEQRAEAQRRTKATYLRAYPEYRACYG